MSNIESIQGWHPYIPRCYSCSHYSPGLEYGDYGQILSEEPWCHSFNAPMEDLPWSMFDKIPGYCRANGRYELDWHYAFWASPFCENLDGSDESTKRAFDGFVLWMENIKAV